MEKGFGLPTMSDLRFRIVYCLECLFAGGLVLGKVLGLCTSFEFCDFHPRHLTCNATLLATIHVKLETLNHVHHRQKPLSFGNVNVDDPDCLL